MNINETNCISIGKCFFQFQLFCCENISYSIQLLVFFTAIKERLQNKFFLLSWGQNNKKGEYIEKDFIYVQTFKKGSIYMKGLLGGGGGGLGEID